MTASLQDTMRPIISIVESSRPARDHLASQIDRMRLQSRSYASASEFWKSVDNRLHGCVILDSIMPGLQGATLLDELHYQNLALPIIALSGQPDSIVSAAPRAEQAFELLPKPVEYRQLRDSVCRALQADRQRRQQENTAPTAPILIPADAARIEEHCEDFGLLPAQLLESSGNALCQFALQRLPTTSVAPRVFVLAGKGRNAANAMAAARRLVNYGAKVTVFTTHALESMAPLTAYAARSAMRCGVPVLWAKPGKLHPPDLILDGLLGLGLEGAPRGQAAEMIHWANSVPCPKIACETPSGLDADRGEPHTPTLIADATLALGLPMRGVMASKAAKYTGELFVGDIGVPLGVYRALAIHTPPALFSRGQFLRVRC